MPKQKLKITNFDYIQYPSNFAAELWNDWRLWSVWYQLAFKHKANYSIAQSELWNIFILYNIHYKINLHGQKLRPNFAKEYYKSNFYVTVIRGELAGFQNGSLEVW